MEEAMKSFYTTIIILIIVTTNLYTQIEFKDKAISDSKFQGEQFILEIGPEELDSIIISTMETYNIPGLTSLIIKDDFGIIWNRNYGYANVELNRSVEDSTLFWIASISKTIMATAIMQLWEDGLFDLEDNINDYLDFQVINPNHPNDTITFKMLMTHTSSISDNNSILNPLLTCGDSPVPLDSFLINYFTPGGIYYSTANFTGSAPGTSRVYTNAGACLLAYLVERLSGMSFDQYCRENIFDPLDMDETSWFLEGLDTTKIATPYVWTGGQYVAMCHQGWPIYPITFLKTNKIEFEHFLSAYMNWGRYNGATILDSTTIDLMLTVHVASNDQGLIWYKTPISPEYLLWGHPGGQQGTGSMIFFNQEEDWGFTVLFNTFPSILAYLDIANAISEYASEYVVPVPISQAIEDLNGDYVPDHLGETVKVQGVVFSPNFQTTNNSFYIWDEAITSSSGASRGTDIFMFEPPVFNWAKGDMLTITGEVAQFNGMTEIIPADSSGWVFVSSGNPTPDPIVLTLAQYKADPEAYEGSLVGFISLTLVDGTWPTSSSTNLQFSDGIDTVTFRIDSDTDIPGQPEPIWPRDILGIGSQFDSSTPPDGGYQIFPRYYALDFLPPGTIPVELTSFTASTSEGKVYLNWTTATELNNLGFEIERKLDNSDWDRIGFVEGHGTTTEPIVYFYSDDIINITANSLAYRLKQIDFDGTYEYSEEIEIDVGGPLTFSLEQNYPNPFNPSTNIKYNVPENGFVKLAVYNLVGEEVDVLVNGQVNAGFYEIEFDASKLPSGVYIYRLTAGSFTNSKKMLLLK
jgi:CubicO group peptidase (beta-lactamase class C family)